MPASIYSRTLYTFVYYRYLSHYHYQSYPYCLLEQIDMFFFSNKSTRWSPSTWTLEIDQNGRQSKEPVISKSVPSALEQVFPSRRVLKKKQESLFQLSHFVVLRALPETWW